MIKTFFMVLAYVYASLFASAPLTDKEDVDQYIARLKAALPGRACHDCFFNLCDMTKEFGEIKFFHSVYYFVDTQNVAECPKEGLERELGLGFVFCDLRNTMRHWIKNRRDKFIKDFSASPDREIALRENCLGLYSREPFLRCLNEPVVVCDSLSLLKYAELLTALGMRAGDSDVARPVAPVTQRHVTRASKDPRAQVAAESAKKKLDARRAAQNVLVPAPASVSVVVEEVKPTLPSVPAVMEEVKSTPSMTVPNAKKGNKGRNRKRKDPGGISAAVAPLGLQLVSTSVVTADSDGDVVMKIKPSPGTAPTVVTADSDGDVVMKIKPFPQDSKPVLMEEDSAEEDPIVHPLSPLAAVLPHVLTPSVTNIGEIIKRLTAEQRLAMQAAYAGKGMTPQEQYDQACREGLLATLRSPTPARSAARSVSRATSRVRMDTDENDVVRMPTPSSRSISRMRGASEEEVMRSMTPARIRPLTVSFEGDAKNVYEKYFTLPGNEAANARYREFLQGVSTQGANYYIGKAEHYRARTGAYKLNIGGKARIIFKRGEGDSLIIIENPAHYGD